MEFLEGKTLRDVLQERATLPIDEALSIALQVARGVTAAHEVNVVHRDIKPENIFCTSFGTVKVLDLGLAKIIGFDSKETDPNGLIGTAAYMAPEQLDGLPADARSDVYSLGLVTYECLAGFHPLVPDGIWPSREEIALRQLTFDPPLLRHLPRAAWQVVARATHKNPAFRYASMQEFAAALHRLRHQLGATASSEPGSSPAPGRPRQARAVTSRWSGGTLVRRHPMLIGAVVGLSTAAALFAWRARPGPMAGPAAPPAVTSGVVTTAAPTPPEPLARHPNPSLLPTAAPPAAVAPPASVPPPDRTAPLPDRPARLAEQTAATLAPAGSTFAPANEPAPPPRRPSSEASRSPQAPAGAKERSRRAASPPAERMPSSGL
jgi:serine/threonine-protein kinase